MFALAHDEDRARCVPRDTFGGFPMNMCLRPVLPRVVRAIKSILQSRAAFVMTSNAIPTWTTTSLRNSGSIILLPNSSSSFFMDAVGKPGPDDSSLLRHGTGATISTIERHSSCFRDRTLHRLPPDFLSLPVTAVRNCSFRSRVSPNLITRGEAPVRRSRRVGISEFREA